IDISEAEIDAFLRSEGQRGLRAPHAQEANQSMAQPEAMPEQASPAPAQRRAMGLAHILIAVPEGASSSEKQSLRQEAESIHRRVKQGENFAGVAAAESDGPDALDGGDMGVRPMEGWPDLFIEATEGLSEGDISEIFESGNGFHILKILALDTGEPTAAQSAPPPPNAPQAQEAGQSFESQVALPDFTGSTEVEQTHARHILIKTSQVMSDEQAQERLSLLRERIQQGEDFATLARRNSEDGTASQGGDLGWLSPGETVPACELDMDPLQPDDISQPVKSSFGCHLML